MIGGKVVAGPDVRAACRRHLDDLTNGPARGLVWDLAAALRAISFFAVSGVALEGIDTDQPARMSAGLRYRSTYADPPRG